MTIESLERANAIKKSMDECMKVLQELDRYTGCIFKLYADCGDGVNDYITDLTSHAMVAIREYYQSEYDRLKDELERI